MNEMTCKESIKARKRKTFRNTSNENFVRLRIDRKKLTFKKFSKYRKKRICAQKIR